MTVTDKTMPVCSCAKCVELCKSAPGWFTPEEAMRAIKAGYGERLMRDWLEPCPEVGNEERIMVLCPAVVGHEATDAPEISCWVEALLGIWKKGTCCFLEDGLCSLHDTDYKPRQCREALGCKPDETDYTDNYEIARLWQSAAGAKAISAWEQSAC